MIETVRCPEIERAILAIIRLGHFRGIAAKKCGVPPSTFSDWVQRDPDLRRRVEEAEADVEIRALKTVKDRARDDPRTAQWFLERRFKERWGARGRGPVVSAEAGADGAKVKAEWFEGEDGGEHGDE